MKAVFAIGLIAIFALAVEGAPSLPKSHVCSIKGTGTVTIDHIGEETWEGTVSMTRVNQYAIYEFTTTKKGGSGETSEASILIRPDKKSGDYDNNPLCGCDIELNYYLKDYEYDKNFKPLKGVDDYLSFNYYSGLAGMFFTDDKEKKLIGEYFAFHCGHSENTFDKITFVYDKVEFFEHNEVDDLFSPGGWYPNATDALTSLCENDDDSATVFLPSLFALLLALFIAVLF